MDRLVSSPVACLFHQTIAVFAKPIHAAADAVLGANIRWGKMFRIVPERPEFTAYAACIAARPAAQRADAKDKEMAAHAG